MKISSQNKIGPFFILTAAVLWSFGGLLVKLIPWSPMAIIGFRSLLGAAVVAIYMKRPKITFTPSVILGAVITSLCTILFVFANKMTTAANAVVLQYTAPIFVIVISAVFLGKKPKKLELAAALSTFVGISLFFFDKLNSGAMLGNIFSIISGITFAGVFLINSLPDARPEQSIFLGMLINAVLGLPFAVSEFTLDIKAIIAVILLGVLQVGVAYVFFLKGIKLTTPISASLIASAEPILNPVWVLIMTGERPGSWAIIGGSIVILTIALNNILSYRSQARAQIKETI